MTLNEASEATVLMSPVRLYSADEQSSTTDDKWPLRSGDAGVGLAFAHAQERQQSEAGEFERARRDQCGHDADEIRQERGS